MQTRKLGRSDLTIAPLVLGGNVFGWTADEATSFAILDAFVDAGFNAIDTADGYSRWSPAGGGASEPVIGACLKASGKRDQVAIATKLALAMAARPPARSARCSPPGPPTSPPARSGPCRSGDCVPVPPSIRPDASDTTDIASVGSCRRTRRCAPPAGLPPRAPSRKRRCRAAGGAPSPAAARPS